MVKNETIEITLHCNRKSLVAMIRSILGNRKPVDQKKNFNREKILRGQESQKKISSES